MTLKPINRPKIVGERDASQVNVSIPQDTPRTAKGLLTVIGGDDRQQISETQRAPWRMICSLSMHSQQGSKYVGTGWMVGPKTVITAGHCVLDQRAGQMAAIDVTPGRNHDIRPFGTISVSGENTEVHPNWKNSFDPDFDIGVIHLPESLGEETGWFSFAVAEKKDLLEKQMNVGGYPFAIGQEAVSGKELWWHKEAIVDTSDRRIFYATDTSGGQSGSPVWAFEDESDGPIVIGIHAYGASLVKANTADGGFQQANSAPRIDASIAEYISNWIASDTTR